jgi:hypothetical protein
MNLKSRVNDTDTDNLKKLIKKRDEVKRKMTLLKQDESIYENTFSPITKRLETISNQLQEKGIVNNFKPKEKKQETFKQIIPVENKLTLSDRISKLQKRIYKTTPGLYELLFKNNPKKYTQNDLSTYIVVYLTSLCVNWAFFDTRGLVSLAF